MNDGNICAMWWHYSQWREPEGGGVFSDNSRAAYKCFTYLQHQPAAATSCAFTSHKRTSSKKNMLSRNFFFNDYAGSVAVWISVETLRKAHTNMNVWIDSKSSIVQTFHWRQCVCVCVCLWGGRFSSINVISNLSTRALLVQFKDLSQNLWTDYLKYELLQVYYPQHTSEVNSIHRN